MVGKQSSPSNRSTAQVERQQESKPLAVDVSEAPGISIHRICLLLVPQERSVSQKPEG
jgi:hypothetical protein